MGRVWILVPAALLLSACGGGSSSMHKATGPPLQTISVSEKEFSLSPSTISVTKPGTYSFQVTNNGTITHSFEIEGNGIKQRAANISPGSSATLTVTLKKGSYEAFCPIDAHKSRGMLARLLVGLGAASTGGGTTSTTPSTTSSPGY